MIRALLVPSLMKLMGNANWWMPDWTRRALLLAPAERSAAGGGARAGLTRH